MPSTAKIHPLHALSISILKFLHHHVRKTLITFARFIDICELQVKYGTLKNNQNGFSISVTINATINAVIPYTAQITDAVIIFVITPFLCYNFSNTKEKRLYNARHF